MIKKIMHICLVPLVLLVSSCALFRTGTESITDILPRDTDVPGWSRTADASSFTESTIESYKKTYSGLGIVSIASCGYRSFGENGRNITVEIIKFNDILNSYSFFSSVKGLDFTGTCSEEEFLNETTSMIRMGEYIILVTVDRPDLNNYKDLKTFSDTARGNIGDKYTTEKLPAVYSILSRAGAGCVLYSRKGIEKLPGINRIYYGAITENDKKYYVFLSDRESFYNSLNIFQKIITKKYIIIKADNTQSAFTKDETGLYSFVSVYDRWIYGCWAVSDINDGKRILLNIRNVIDSFSGSHN